MNPSSPSLADELMAQLQGAPLQQLSSQLGTDATQTRSAVETALPLLLGALGRNAAQPQGAEALLGALQRDHLPAATGSGGGLDLGGLLGSLLGGGGGSAGSGADILSHVFGSQRPQAEAGLGQATGLGANAGQLLQWLAPIVMSFLAQRVQSGGLDAGSLGRTLGHERERAQQQGGLGGGVLGSLLDQDGDGQVGLSDLVKLGGGLLGGRR
ncbi:DUF937 domain-containing protein [Acidovorax sp. NCPPB 3576]|uniref:DUF937 domain-containing protein n=1 Tax=Acidovorax sp. NCPPB 3576 TaxID=2940488 RepID=UPI00234AEA3C|nr:DUF937 domain-containing protein [Acidovorax sp. NCPPB 3576]WCM89875.1 DUF937 domain-containing protein [Acidovorax sp. NCPPB 3576]